METIKYCDAIEWIVRGAIIATALEREDKIVVDSDTELAEFVTDRYNQYQKWYSSLTSLDEQLTAIQWDDYIYLSLKKRFEVVE